MAFPYNTLGTYTYQNYSYDYTDTVENLMLNNSFNVGSYPDGMFWGGISKYDAPYAYPATATYDFDAQTITISDLYAGIPGVEIPRTQISYCYVPTVQSNTAPFTNGMINWQLNNGITDMTNQKYLTLSNFPTRVRDSLFSSKIPLNKIIFCPYVYYFNLADWNAGNTTITRQQTSIEQWETWERNNQTSDKILVGFGIGECGYIYSNTRVINAGWQSTNHYRFPDNGMFGTVIQSPLSNGFSYGNFNIYIAASGGDRTKYALARESATHEDYYYATSYSNKIYIDSNNVYLPFYNGDVIFDISELLAIDTKNTYWRKQYTQGDKYLIGGYTSQEFQWASVTFQGQIYRVYDTLDDLLKYIASFGRAFCGAMPQRYQHEVAGIIDDLIFAPVLDDNKVYHGEYTRGLANATNPFFTFDDSTDTTYEPTEQGDEPPDDDPDAYGADSIPDLNFSAGAISDFVTMYCLTEQQVSAFGAYLWANIFSEDFVRSIGTILVNDFSINPADILNYIISLRKYPFDLYGKNGYENISQGSLYFGRGVAGIPISGAFGKMQNLAGTFGGEYIEVPAKYNDFRDYEPFTRITVFVPFCGSIELTPSEVVGKRIFITYTVDYSTGNVQADVWVNSDVAFIVGTVTGQIGATVQTTASNNMEVLQKVGSTAANFVKTVASVAAIAATGGVAAESAMAGEISGAEATAKEMGAVSSMLNVTTGTLVNAPAVNSNPIHASSVGSGFAAFATPRARLIVERRKYQVPTNYDHVYGKATNVTVTLSALENKGFTVCKNVDLSGIPATQDELNAIESLLTSGVYF